MNSVMMQEYKKFEDYLKVQKSFKDLENEIDMNNATNIVATLTLNLPVAKREIQSIPEFPEAWKHIFEECRPEIEQAMIFVNRQIASGNVICPEIKNIFRAFHLTKPEDVKVIIVGQDPYHSIDIDTGNPVATGLSFSCNGKQLQPSLRNVFKEIERTEGKAPSSGNLDHWAEQGVLMINICLTVNKGIAKSHGQAWNAFTYKVLKLLLNDVKFSFLCLWGLEAQKIISGRNKVTFSTKKVCVKEAYHPSGLNTKHPFVGCGHFYDINQSLIKNGYNPINWIERPRLNNLYEKAEEPVIEQMV